MAAGNNAGDVVGVAPGAPLTGVKVLGRTGMPADRGGRVEVGRHPTHTVGKGGQAITRLNLGAF